MTEGPHPCTQRAMQRGTHSWQGERGGGVGGRALGTHHSLQRRRQRLHRPRCLPPSAQTSQSQQREAECRLPCRGGTARGSAGIGSQTCCQGGTDRAGGALLTVCNFRKAEGTEQRVRTCVDARRLCVGAYLVFYSGAVLFYCSRRTREAPISPHIDDAHSITTCHS